MKVLLLGRYDRAGASTRLRFLQFAPHLARAGIELEAAPLFGDDYLRALYADGRRSAARVGLAYLRRVGRVLTAGRYDVVWLEKELLPRLPATFERMMAWAGCRYVVDYDDAIFHDYDQHRSRAFRWALGRKIDRVMENATLVVAGNDYLAARARSAGARRVEIVPTVVDLERYPPRTPSASGPLAIGWIGSPSTSAYLREIARPLAALAAEGDARVILVGTDRAVPGVEAELRPWTEAGEAADIRTFDVGVMPLPDEPWARGKCGYKLIQYMASGVPAVASPVGVNPEIVAHGVNGFLASDGAQWQDALQRLRDDPALRAAMGAAGRRVVEQRYSLAVAAPRTIDLLRRAAA